MLQVNASVSFEAKNRKAAEEIIAAWVLNEGARVQVTASEILAPMEVSAGGQLEEVPEPEPLPPLPEEVPDGDS